MAVETTSPDDVLLELARKKFGDLSEAEKRTLRAAPQGKTAVCGKNSDDDDAANDPAKADNKPEEGGWGEEREIDADVIRWLCVNKEAAQHVDPRGLWIYGAKITGTLDLSYASVGFPLELDRCRVLGDCVFYDLAVPGLYFTGTHTKGIKADRIEVKGGLFLRHKFSAEGEVRLLGAKIGGDLDCVGATFKNATGYALVADGVEVKGDIFLRENFAVNGGISLPGAHVAGGFQSYGWNDGSEATLVLRNAALGALMDDEAVWNKVKLDLDGCVYQTISKGPTDAKARLRWLERLEKFTPQPYRQLAKFLHERGDDDGEKKVLLVLAEKVHAEQLGKLPRWQRPFRGFADVAEVATIGYGIRPERAALWAIGLTALGWVLHRRAALARAMAPTDKSAYDEFAANGRQTPRYYPGFNPFIYSLENCLPLVKLGQDDRWQADPAAPRRVGRPRPALLTRAWWRDLIYGRVPSGLCSRRFLQGFRWFMILAGWALATFFVAAVTGIVKKE